MKHDFRRLKPEGSRCALQDRSSPEAVHRSLGGVSFEARFADDDIRTSHLRNASGADGFSMKVDPLYQVSQRYERAYYENGGSRANFTGGTWNPMVPANPLLRHSADRPTARASASSPVLFFRQHCSERNGHALFPYTGFFIQPVSASTVISITSHGDNHSSVRGIAHSGSGSPLAPENDQRPTVSRIR